MRGINSLSVNNELTLLVCAIESVIYAQIDKNATIIF